MSDRGNVILPEHHNKLRMYGKCPHCGEKVVVFISKVADARGRPIALRKDQVARITPRLGKESDLSIARRFGVSVTAVCNLRRRKGIKSTIKVRMDLKFEKVRELAGKGLGFAEIGKVVSLSRQRVEQILKDTK